VVAIPGPTKPKTSFTMTIRVAVAGATSGLGHAIAFGLLEHSDVELVLLTRLSPSPPNLSFFTSQGAILKPVDYTSVTDLISALEGVDTVISTIFGGDDASPSLNLLEAAKAAGVRRFAPSEFAMSPAADARYDFYAIKRQVWEAVKKSGLEYTHFYLGIFMDYLAFGASKPVDVPLKIYPFIVNISTQKATIPGTGDEQITFTAIRDVGRLVAAAVKLPGRWPEELPMRGETTTYNQVVREAEAVTGKKIDVEYWDKATIAKGIEEANAKGDEMKTFSFQVMGTIADGLGPVPPVLNQLVPEISLTSVKELLTQHWST